MCSIFLWGAILDIITNFCNICSTSNLPAKLYIEYSHCYIFLPHSIYICYVLEKSFLCFHTVWSTLRTVWYDAPRAGFSKIAPRPLLAIFCRSQKWRLYAVQQAPRIDLTNIFFNGQKCYLQKQKNNFSVRTL